MIFAFDIDGTLRTTDTHVIPDSAVLALNKLRAAGHHIVVATGRSIDSLINTHIDDIFAFDGYVCNSGQALLDKDLKLIKKMSIPRDMILKVMDIASQHNSPLTLKCIPRFITMEPNEHVKEACAYFNNPLPTVGTYTNQEVGAFIAYGPKGYNYDEYRLEELDVMPSETASADIVLKGVSKANGIKYFMEQWGYDEYTAFGDSLNDEEMFKHAAFSICLGQGNNQLKQMASYVTDSIYDDGVYKACIKLGYIQDC